MGLARGESSLSPSRKKTGIVLSHRGTFISAIENLGGRMFLVNFGSDGEEILPARSRRDGRALHQTTLYDSGFVQSLYAGR